MSLSGIFGPCGIRAFCYLHSFSAMFRFSAMESDPIHQNDELDKIPDIP